MLVLLFSLRELKIQILNLRLLNLFHLDYLTLEFVDLDSVLFGALGLFNRLKLVHVLCLKLNTLLLKDMDFRPVLALNF